MTSSKKVLPALKPVPFKAVIDRSRVITAVTANPKMPGCKAFERFKLYRKGMTVSAALKAGVTASDIRWDSEREFIKIAPVKA